MPSETRRSETIEQVVIPYAPRRWAKLLHASFRRWSVLVLHRRAGKTTAVLNHHQRAALDDAWEYERLRFLLPEAPDRQLRALMTRRIYWHVMPSLKQAKIVAWDMLKAFAEPIPGAKPNNTDLEITYPNGNKLRLLGADDPDSLRGPGLSGLSLDEYSQIPTNAFSEVLSKSLADHLGYCIFSGTIKGKDQLHRMYTDVKDEADWYAVWQDVDRSLATEAGPTITALTRAMEDDRKLVLQGVMTQDAFDQEWYLDAEASIQGAWYAKEMLAAKKDGRITRVPYEPGLPVDTDWDLGIVDAMAIWFSQSLRTGEVRLIDYYENSGEGFQHYIKVLKEKPYIYGKHHGPHDLGIREYGLEGKSRKDIAASLGLRFEPPLAMTKSVIEDIDVCRAFLSRCWFDEERCAPGLEALRHYRKAWNQRLSEFTGTPVHDWASHGADAFRTLGVRWQLPRKLPEMQAPKRPFLRHSDTAWMG